MESEIRAEKGKLDAATGMKADLEKQKRQLETEIMMDNDRIKNIESRLGGVTNNKEFHAASKESEKAKKLISDRQKTIGELTEKIASQETLASEIEAKMNDLTGLLDTKKTEVGSAVGEADKEISAYVGDRDAMVAAVQPALLSRYNRIRTKLSDAVVTIRNGHCSACNVALPPQMYIQVQKGLELIPCPSCQRLLYYKAQ